MKKKNFIILGVSLISLISVTAVTSTIAWYVGSSYLAITDINIGLKDPSLSISIDDENFTDKLSTDDLMNAGKFNAVSSMFSEEWIEEKAEKPVFKSGYNSTNKLICNQSSQTTNATSGYFSQEMYIKCDTNAYITLDSEKTTFIADESKHKALVENEKFMEKMESIYPNLSGEALKEAVLFNLNNVVKSLRLSILVLDGDDSDDYDDYAYHIVDPYKEDETYFGGILDTDGDKYYDTYSHKEILYGEISCSDETKTVEECVVYDDALTASTTLAEEELTCFDSQNKVGDQKVNFESSAANGLVIETENSIAIEDVEDSLLIPVFSNRSQKIILSFYQEGWDLENTDFVMYSHFYVDVQFMIAPVSPRF